LTFFINYVNLTARGVGGFVVLCALMRGIIFAWGVYVLSLATLFLY